MVKVLLTLILSAYLLFPAIPALGQGGWPSTFIQVEKSLYRITAKAHNDEDDTDRVYSCTGWSINEDKGYVVTADHCIKGEMRADGELGVVVYENGGSDLAVLKVTNKKPALGPGPTPVKGQEVAAIGYGYGFDQPMAKVSHVATVDQVINEIGGGHYLIVDSSYIGGMSGGPVVNLDGQVISIVQQGDPSDNLGLGRGIAEIKDRLGFFGS